MKKYIRAVTCLFYSFIKFCLIKLFHLKGFNFSLFNLISPFVEVEIGKKAFLSFGKMIRVRSGSKIRVRNGAVVQLGDNTSLNHGCMIISHEKIIIGKDVQLGPNVFIYDHDHDFKSKNGLRELKYKTNPVEIGNNVWVGANTVILRGSKIGDNCVIGAGTIVKGEFPSNSIIVQNKQTNVISYQSSN